MWAGHMLTLRMDAFMNVKSGCNTQLHGIICGWNLQQWVCGTHLHWLWVEHVIVSRLNTHTLMMNGQGTHRWDGGSTLMTSRRNTIRWWVVSSVERVQSGLKTTLPSTSPMHCLLQQMLTQWNLHITEMATYRVWLTILLHILRNMTYAHTQEYNS